MKVPDKLPFTEKDISVLDEMLRQLKNNKPLSAESLAKFENINHLSAEEKNERYEHYFKIYKQYDNRFSYFNDKGNFVLKHFTTSSLSNIINKGGFRGIYDEYFKKLDEYKRWNTLRQKEIDEAKIVRYQASKVKWEFWFSVAAVLISLAALAVSIFNH